VFSHLPVNVSEESFDIYDGLSGYFDDTVDFEGRKMRMEVSLVDIPPILQIQLQVRYFMFFEDILGLKIGIASAIQPKHLATLQVACLCSFQRDPLH